MRRPNQSTNEQALRGNTMFHVFVLFELPDGEHVGHIKIDVPSHTVHDETLDSHVRRHFGQRPHVKPRKWWRVPADAFDREVERARAYMRKKYPNRESVDSMTGGQPTRLLVDASPFVTEDETPAEGDD